MEQIQTILEKIIDQFFEAPENLTVEITPAPELETADNFSPTSQLISL